MSAERDVTPIVRTWLQDGVTSLPDHVLDRVLDQVPAIRQERRGFAARRNESMHNALKLAIAAAAVIAVAVAGLSVINRSDNGIGGPPPTLSASPTSAVDTERALMQVALSSVRLWIDNPTSWSAVSDDAGAPPFVTMRASTDPPSGMAVYFYAPTTTYQDPCQQVPVSPPVGPTVDDFVQALRAIPGISTTEPANATLGGLPATYLEMTTDDTLPCAPEQFYIWAGLQTKGLGQIVRTWVLEVDGTRIVASALRYPDALEGALAEQQQVIDSIQFE